MRIDLHCHTTPRSTCSALSPAELIALARERGLDGICLTEHDRAWPADELAQLQAGTDMLVLSGIELTTDMGHVLGFGLPAPDRSLAVARDVYEFACEHGGLLFLAHPARDGLLRVTADTVAFFESVEAHNGSDTRLQNMAATGLAKGFRLPGIGGSDCHSAAEVGRAATQFRVPVTDQASFLEALRAGAYQAVAME